MECKGSRPNRLPCCCDHSLWRPAPFRPRPVTQNLQGWFDSITTVKPIEAGAIKEGKAVFQDASSQGSLGANAILFTEILSNVKAPRSHSSCANSVCVALIGEGIGYDAEIKWEIVSIIGRSMAARPRVFQRCSA